MNKDLTIKELISLLVDKMRIEYGSLEIKVHNGKWTNYTISHRTNFNESEANEVLKQIKES